MEQKIVKINVTVDMISVTVDVVMKYMFLVNVGLLKMMKKDIRE